VRVKRAARSNRDLLTPNGRLTFGYTLYATELTHRQHTILKQPMNTVRANLHNKVQNWTKRMGFRLNSTETNEKSQVTTRHYFFETFNFFEKLKADRPERPQYICFDQYGEKLKVRSLLDLQAAFYDNISQLK
jgi:hypothetical protein